MRPLDLMNTQRRDIPIDDPMDILSEAITWITDGPSHVRLFIGADVEIRPGENFDFWEVTFPRCRFGKMEELSEKYLKEYQMEVGRHRLLPYPLTQEIFDKALTEMKRLEGSYYDLGELLITQFLDEIGLDHTDNSNPDLFVCSSGVEHIYRVIGFPFCEGHEVVSPEDIVKSPQYEIVPWGVE